MKFDQDCRRNCRRNWTHEVETSEVCTEHLPSENAKVKISIISPQEKWFILKVHLHRKWMFSWGKSEDEKRIDGPVFWSTPSGRLCPCSQRLQHRVCPKTTFCSFLFSHLAVPLENHLPDSVPSHWFLCLRTISNDDTGTWKFRDASDDHFLAYGYINKLSHAMGFCSQVSTSLCVERITSMFTVVLVLRYTVRTLKRFSKNLKIWQARTLVSVKQRGHPCSSKTVEEGRFRDYRRWDDRMTHTGAPAFICEAWKRPNS